MKSGILAGLSTVATSKPFIALTATTVTATSTFLIWYNVVKTAFEDVAEIASNTDFAITIVNNPLTGTYSLGFKESEETEETEETFDEEDVVEGEKQEETKKYTTSEEVIEAIAAKLKEDGIKAKSLYLDEDSGYVQKFIGAEIVTNYPNLSHKYEDVGKSENIIGQDKTEYLQGIVNIIRRKAEAEDTDQGQYLEYVPYGDEGTPGTFAYMVSTNNEEVLKYFSINETNWDIYIATYKKVYGDEENSYTITSQTIPYKNIVAKYSVPFEFLVALTEVSENPEWVEKVAEMVSENSKIDIVVQDCLMVSEKEATYSYDEVKETYEGIDVSDVETTSHSTTSVTTTELNTVTTYIREVDTWIVNLKQNYVKTELDLTEETDVEVLVDTNKNFDSETMTQTKTTNRKNTTVTRIKKNINYEKAITTVNNENDEAEVSEEDDSNINKVENIGAGITSNEKKFLGLWKNKKGQYTPYYNDDGTYNVDALFDPDGKEVKYRRPRTLRWVSPASTTISNAKVLFELLGLSERTQEHEQLMKYLMYIYTDKDYGVKEFNYSLFSLETFTTVSRFSGNVLLEYLKAWEGHEGLSSDGTKYKIGLVLGNRTVGYGVDLETSGYEQRFIDNGYDTSTGAYVDVEFVDSITLEEITKRRDMVVQKTATCSPPLTEQQIDALAVVSYQYGNIGNFVEMYNKYGNTEELKNSVRAYKTGGGYGRYYFVKGPESNGRAQANWKLFNEGKYMTSNGSELISNPSLLEAADSVTQYVIDNGLTYKATDNVNYTFPIQNNGRKTLSCSSFVQQCLLQAGYSQCAGGEKLWARTNSGLSLKDFKNLGIEVELINDITKLQPGDILQFGTGYHVVIVYSINGNNVTYKGMPEAENQGQKGKTQTIQQLQAKRCYALRIKS